MTEELILATLTGDSADDAQAIGAGTGAPISVQPPGATVFIQATQPTSPPIPSVWYQTDAEGVLTGQVQAFTFDPGAPSNPPSSTVAPAVTPTTAFGGTVLSCTQGTWTNFPTSYAYQWFSGVTAISGATASTYTAVTGDVGNAISCKVTATNANGSATAASNSVTPTSLPTPASIFGSDLFAFTDATLLSGSSGGVATWPDQSGNGNDFTQATGGNQPTIATASEDGLKVLHFVASSSQSMATAITGTAQPVAIIIVFKPTTAASPMTSKGLFKCGSSGGAPAIGLQPDSNTNGQYSVALGGSGGIIPNASIPLAGTPYHLWAFVINGVSSAITEDAGNAGGANTGDMGATANLNGFTIGVDSAGRYADMNVRAVILVKRVPTVTDMTNLIAYSQVTWATP
jgi:hypothetical protein